MRWHLGFTIAFSALGCTLLIPFDDLPDATAPAPPPPNERDAAVEAPAVDVAEPCFPDPIANKLLSPASGFPANWDYVGTSYKQTASRNGVDVAFLTSDQPIGDVSIEVDVISTQPSSGSPVRRQNLIVVGATTAGGIFKGYGCGVELTNATPPANQLTSAVRLDATSGAVETIPLKEERRDIIKVDETFRITARLEKGTLTCTSIIKGVPTTATFSGQELANARGSVGLSTRQNVGTFSNMRVCRL